MKARILIPDYPGQQVISGIKALYENGDECDLAWKIGMQDRVFKSKYIHRMIDIPSAENDPSSYINSLIDLIKSKEYDLILPFGNNACHEIALAQDRIREHTRLLSPRPESHMIAFDKFAMAEHCRSAGLSTPWTTSINDERDLEGISNEAAFPLVLKTRSGAGISSPVKFAQTYEELVAFYREFQAAYLKSNQELSFAPIIQEYIPGLIQDACTLSVNGEMIAFLSQIRQRMYPITGGVGAINLTTTNRRLEAAAVKVLKSLNWSGPAQLEYKFDKRSHTYQLIEMNPKLWGTLDLSIRSGVNFPVLIRNLLMGEKSPHSGYPPRNYYYFLFPQATLAAIQQARRFGIGSLRIKSKKARVFTDFDWSDIRPQLWRIIKTIRMVVTGYTR